MKIGQVADAAQRQQVMTVLVEFLGQTTGDVAWLREISARGVPLYGTEAGNLVRLNPDGSRETVQAMTAATAG